MVTPSLSQRAAHAESLTSIFSLVLDAHQSQQCYLSLVRVHQAIAARAFHLGQAHCHAANDSLKLSRLASSNTSTLNSLDVSIANKFDPSFLPREIFHVILESASTYARVRCLRLSKGWKKELEAEPRIWRTIMVKLKKTGLPVFKTSSRLSGQTLEKVGLEFFWNNEIEYDTCFKILEDSSQNLKRLEFTGPLTHKNATLRVLLLAARCPQLQLLLCKIDEDVRVEEGSYDDYEDEEEEEEDYNRRRDLAIDSLQKPIHLDDIKFKSLPFTIDLSSSLLSLIFIGQCDFFSRAKSITLRFREASENLTQGNIWRLLSVSCKTLETFSLSQTRVGLFVESDASFETEISKPIHLEKLLELKLNLSQQNRTADHPIVISAPQLTAVNLNAGSWGLIKKQE